MDTRLPGTEFGELQPSTAELLTTLVNSAEHLVWCTNVDGTKILYANPVAEKIYGRPFEDLLRNQDYWIEAIHPLDRSYVLKNLTHLLEHEQIEQEYRIVRPNGTVVWLHDRIKVIRDGTGTPMYVGGIGTDITAIRESEALYSSLVESLPLHVIRKDKDGKVVFGNQRYCESIGLPLKEVLGKTDFDLFPPDLAQKYVDDDRKVIESGKVFNAIEAHQNSDGDRVFVELFKSPIRDSAGRVSGIQVMFWDVTERKLADEEIRKAKEAAEYANQAKGEFLANMSHEIRTPMNGILGMTELLFKTDPTVEQRGYLKMVKQSASSLLRLLNDILDFSKIEAGKLDLEFAAFSLRDCVGHTVQSLGVRAGEKGLELLYQVDPDVPDTMVGDSVRLGQIIVNLVGNAIKFTEEGEIKVSIRNDPDGSCPGCLIFSVSDTGIGIPADQQKMIFDSFSQVDASTTRRFGGTGLGLAISSRLVALMDGRIWLESKVDQGTTFHFTTCFDVLPDEHVEDLRRLHGVPVLIVDDNLSSQTILGELLSHWGLAPTVVDNGPIAIDELKRARAAGKAYQLAILDCQMQGMDGFNIAACVHEDVELRDCHMIMLSSTTHPGDVERCRRLGISRYIQKPPVQSELLETILLCTGIHCVEEAVKVEETANSSPFQGRQLRILLAEDSVVNQQVAIGLLSSFGHDLTVVPNGEKAIAELDTREFDLVLMDVQMPRMDGLTATRLIRESENGTDKHIPIIAMTAGAMKGDQEKCLESGMDGYLSKPIDPDTLYAEIARCTDLGFDQSQISDSDAPKRAILDLENAQRVCRNDDQRLKELAQTLYDESEKLLDEIRESLDSGDLESFGRFVHTLKGSAGVFGAASVVEAATTILDMVSSGSREAMKAPTELLLAEVADMMRALSDLAHESEPQNG